MPKVGEKEFDYTDEGIVEAQVESAKTGSPMQVSDAMKRSQTMYPGGGKTGYNVPKYKHGGVAPYEVLEGEQIKDESILGAEAQQGALKAMSIALKRKYQEITDEPDVSQVTSGDHVIIYGKKGGKVKK
jgi:hypothetical protein